MESENWYKVGCSGEIFPHKFTENKLNYSVRALQDFRIVLAFSLHRYNYPKAEYTGRLKTKRFICEIKRQSIILPH